MQPRTKQQRRLVRIDKSIAKISEAQKAWAYKFALNHNATRLKSGKITCLDCGHSFQSKSLEGWQDEIMEWQCPNCKVMMAVNCTRQKVFSQRTYVTILGTHKGHQVIRHCLINAYYKAGQVADRHCREVSRTYIDDNGVYTIFGQVCQQSWSGERWTNTFELRHRNSVGNHDFVGIHVYPRHRILPTIERNGYWGKDFGLTYLSLFTNILKYPKAETLLKADQGDLLKRFNNTRIRAQIERHWSSIKICIRRNYIVRDAGLWLDYLDLLGHFGKDLHSHKYVCPLDLRQFHNKYVLKKEREDNEKAYHERMKKIRLDEIEYRKNRKKFFNLEFDNGRIKIKFVKSVNELKSLGDIMKHCIYRNEYHKEKNSLLFYAELDNVPLETIEFDLKQKKVVQSRGYDNDPTEFNKEIVELVNSHSKEIMKIAV